MPIRKIPKNYRSVTGFFSSLKNNKSIAFESTLERDFYLYLEFEEDVASYEEQPLKIEYKINTLTYSYTPDAIVYYNSKNKKPCIYEVKYTNDLKLFTKNKRIQAESFAAKKDFNFKFFTEKNCSPIYIKNLHFLYSFKDTDNIEQEQKIIAFLSNHKSISYYDFLNLYFKEKSKQAEIIPFLWKLVLKKDIKINLEEKISNQTILKASNEKN